MSKPRMDATSSSASGSAKSLVKGLALVDLVAESDTPLRQIDLASASGLPRPTAIRLLDALCEADMLRVDPEGVYRLGPRVAFWGQAFLDRLDIRHNATDLIEHLVTHSGETCFIGVLDRNTVLYIAAVNSPHPVRPAARVGSRMPLHSTGIGKVLLSACTPAERDELLTYPLEQRTPNTLIERDALFAQLDLVAQRGFAVDEVENEDGVRCVAAPVKDHRGQTVAALSVSAPAYRFSPEDLSRLAPEVVRVAGELSTRLGFRPAAELRGVADE